MVELYPAPFSQLLRRIFFEYEREGKIFDLPKAKFYRGDEKFDTSVSLHQERAATPVGPAAGPQSQLAQNIVLSWLAGSRILEFKTVQINDELKIPRPCIDATNVGYNVEWSQELKLAQSVREYVAGSMLIDILKHANIPEIADHRPDAPFYQTIFDMSVGYDLAGIRSPQVVQWMEQLRDAGALVAELRDQIPPEFARFRDIEFNTRISDSITLSTFHGCPAHEIERIVEFLLGELDVHTIIKMNPTLLGREAVEALLHDQLGYQDIRVTQEAFDKDLQFDQAIEICHRLGRLAARKGKRLGVKFSNTLVVVNHRSFFTDETMYLSGAPLHVITLNLVKKFRAVMGPDLPISFSAGIDQQNFPEAVAQGFVPVTTCTDLLRPGGYGRLPGYLTRLHQRMRAVGTKSIGDYIIRAEGNAVAAFDLAVEQLPTRLGELNDAWQQLPAIARDTFQQWSQALRDQLGQPPTEASEELNSLFSAAVTQFDRELLPNYPEQLQSSLRTELADLYQSVVRRAGWLNTETIVPRTTLDPRYSQAKNEAVPRKIGSKLWLYDCINCDKCIPVCPNDANFAYELKPLTADCLIYQVNGSEIERLPGRQLKIGKVHQIGNFADFCNECGNCDIFCPEDGGPYIEKPRFFGSLATMQLHHGHDGCYFERTAERDAVYGRFAGRDYQLIIERQSARARFSDGKLALEIDRNTGECQQVELISATETGHQLDSYYYHVLNALLDGVIDGGKINFLNVEKH